MKYACSLVGTFIICLSSSQARSYSELQLYDFRSKKANLSRGEGKQRITGKRKEERNEHFSKRKQGALLNLAKKIKTVNIFQFDKEKCFNLQIYNSGKKCAMSKFTKFYPVFICMA